MHNILTILNITKGKLSHELLCPLIHIEVFEESLFLNANGDNNYLTSEIAVMSQQE